MIPAVRSLSRCDHRLPGRAPSASQHQLQSTGGVPPAMAIPVSGSRISLGCLRMVIRTCLWGAIEHSPRVPSLYMSRSLRDAVIRSLPSRPTLSTVAVGRRPVCGPTPGRSRAKLMDFAWSQQGVGHINDKTLSLPAASGSEVSLVALCQAEMQTC